LDTTQLLKGALDLAILAVISVEDQYGYEIAKRLRDSGFTEIGDASVYGTLRRLEGSGSLRSYFMESEDGPNRKYYSITKPGQIELASAEKTWTDFSKTMTSLLAESTLENKKGATK
jgi:PadR family transcriptional regulator PadR